MSIEILDIDDLDASRLAEASGPTFYDAAYLWVAQKLAAELVTLDKDLQAAVKKGDDKPL